MADGERTCPLCTEEMDLTDQQLKPCKCGYDICVWCWHHIIDMAERDNTEGRCPACRTVYNKEKMVGTAANCEGMASEYISERRQKSQKAKTKTSEGRKHLASVRVIQRNLVYIIGLPSSLADEDMLESKEYFGQYGKVLKVSISRTNSTGQNHSSSLCNVYLTYAKEEEAVRCIQSVHGFVLDGRSLKACFGTTKYCHTWLRNMSCSNPDCLYLHEIGTPEDRFTKDEILSAYTRSRVHQITGATNNLQRRSGSVLPPPAEIVKHDITPSAKIPLKNVSNNTVFSGKGSPPNSACGRSNILPAAALWGSRVSTHFPTATTGPLEEHFENSYSKLICSPSSSLLNQSIVSTNLASDISTPATEESCSVNMNGRCDVESNQTNVNGPQIRGSESLQEYILESPGHYCSSSASEDENDVTSIQPRTTHFEQSRDSVSHIDDDLFNYRTSQSESCAFSSTEIKSHLRKDDTDLNRPQDLTSDKISPRKVGKSGGHDFNAIEIVEPFSSATLVPSKEESKWFATSFREVEPTIGGNSKGNLQSIVEQRLEHTVLPLSPQLPNYSEEIRSIIPGSWQHNVNEISNSWQCSKSIEDKQVNTSIGTLDSEFSDVSIFSHKVNDLQTSTGSNEENFRNTISLQNSLVSNVEMIGNSHKLHGDVLGFHRDEVQHLGESDIISDILSLDCDPWDNSLALPHNFADLLSHNNKQSGSFKVSNSKKPQSKSQSRFSFARHEESSDHPSKLEFGFNSTGHVDGSSNGQAFSRGMNNYDITLQNDYTALGLVGSDISYNSSSNRVASKAPISVPPGFSSPCIVPRGISSRDIYDQSYGITYGQQSHSNFSKNQYHMLQSENVVSMSDLEFTDPAILEVGKGIANLSVDYNPDLSRNDPRLQLLQHPDCSQQNLRYANDIGNGISSIGNTYIQSNQIHNHSQSPFPHLSLQHSINSQFSRGQWGGQSEAQSINDLGLMDALRREGLERNRYFRIYDEFDVRMLGSDNLYSRAFGI